ncbi:hypothetical protein YC2023_017948 [Brassica napus]
MKSLGERSQLNYGAPRRRIKQSSYVTVMPFTNQEIFSSREFSPPEKLEMANLLSDEPTTNSIMPKMIIHVLNVQESLGLDGFQKQTCLGQMEKPIKYWLREKMDFDQASNGHNNSCFLVWLAPSKLLYFVGLVRHIKQQLKFGSIKRFSAPLVSPFNPSEKPLGYMICSLRTLRGDFCVTNKLPRETLVWERLPLKSVKMFEADQRRLFSQFEVREFCENLVEGVVKALKDVSKIQKKSTTTRAPVAKPSLFINEKPKGKSENNLEDLKDFSDFLPIFDEYGEELMEILIICEDNCDLPFPEPDFMFDKEHTIAELTFLQPEHPSSLVLFSQDFEEKPFDYPHQGLLLGTRRTMDVDLYPIFDEEDDNLDELTPIVDEEAPNITSINMENHICFDPDTTFTPLSTDIQEHCEKLDLINSLPKMFVKINSQDVKSFGFDKVKEFCVSSSIFENMINSFKLFKPDKLSDKKCFQYGNDIPSGLFLSFHQFVKHYKGLDHLKKSFELDLQQLVLCSRKSFDSFVFKENSFSLSSYGHELITGILFASSYALDDFMGKQVQPQKSESIDRAHQPEIWRCMYSRKMSSKLQGSFFPKFSCTKFYMFFRFILHDSFPFDTGKMDLGSNLFQEGGNDVPLGSAPGKTDMHGLIMGSSKDICSLFESYLRNQEASTHEITWRTFSNYRAPRRRISSNRVHM